MLQLHLTHNIAMKLAPRILLLLILGWTTLSVATAAPKQNSKRQATPDPYFNPQLDVQNSLSNHRPDASSSQSSIEPWQPPAAANTDSATTNQPASFLPPNTPSNKAPNTNEPNVLYPLAPRPNSAFANPSSANSFQPATGITTSKTGSPLSPLPNSQFNSQFKAQPNPPNRPSAPGTIIREKAAAPPTQFQNKPSSTVASVASPPQLPPAATRTADASDKFSSQSSIESQSDRAGYQTFEPSRLLAMVGNEPIFVGDVLFEVNQMIDRFMAEAPDHIKETERQKLIKRMLPKFVDEKMLYVGTLEMLPEGADVSKILEQAFKEFNSKALPKMMEDSGIKKETDFDAQLRATGYSLRKLRLSWSQDQLTKYFLSQQLNVKTEVTHQEMLDAYRNNVAEYAIPAKAKWEQVMIRFDQTSSREQAQEELVELGNQIVYGAKMEAVAKEHSQGYQAADGGQHDWTTQGALVLKELDSAIFTLPIGQLSEIIETKDGFHIVRVLDRSDATHTPFLEAQVEIKKKLQEEMRTTAFKKHLEKLKEEIPVEYYDFNAPIAKAPGTTLR